MKHCWDIIQELASDNGKKFKQHVIEREAAKLNDEFFKGLAYGLDNFKTFGVKRIEQKTCGDECVKRLDASEFYKVCDSLISRELTGNAALREIERLMENSGFEEWNNWYRLILQKDFKAGFSESTVNKATVNYPQYKIATFSCMLAEDSGGDSLAIAGKKIIQSKLDGVRCLTIAYPDGRVDMFSRNGKPISNFPKIEEQISVMKTMHTLSTDVWVFDGELMSSSFQGLMSQFQRKTDVQTDDMQYYVFDMLTLEEFRSGVSHNKQCDRINNLNLTIASNKGILPNVFTLDYEIVDMDTELGRIRFNEINNEAVKNKFEGIMAKELDAKYVCKRSKSWLKLKPTISLDMTVVSVEEGKPESKYVGSMGALNCKCEYNGITVEVSCGSGFSDEERTRIWEDRGEVVGRIIEVTADAITNAKDGGFSMRFPRKARWRDLPEYPGVKF